MEDSPVKIFPLPEPEPDSPEHDQDSGTNTSESFASYDRATSSWKTSQLLLTGDSTAFSDRWPIAGTMRNGRVYKRSTWVPRISVTDFLLLPTPAVSSQGNKSYGPNAVYRPSLQEMARRNLWPTPRASMWHGGDILAQIHGTPSAMRRFPSGARTMWPTPTARDWKDGTATSCANVPVNSVLGRAVHIWPTPTVEGNHNRAGLSAKSGDGLQTAVNGSLSPEWVSVLMGFPPKHTEID